MGKQVKVELTQSLINLEGVQVTVNVTIGDWRKSVSISPIDYEAFKRWHEIYAEHVVASIVKQIEYDKVKK